MRARTLFSLRRLDVRDLQRRADREAQRRAERDSGSAGRSRAAELHLVAALARAAEPALAALAATLVALAATYGRTAPVEATVWVLMTGVALIATRQYARGFSSANRSSARPFRWRADYTHALAVAGTAFASGAFLLTSDASAAAFYVVFAAIAAGAAVAGIALSAHPPALAAILLPAGGLLSLAAAAHGAPPLAAAAGVGLVFAAAVIGGALAIRQARAASRLFPRAAPMIWDEVAPATLAPDHGRRTVAE